jgi:murein DD-endopeptidase MepM/ murein hydrolase activator NlpD
MRALLASLVVLASPFWLRWGPDSGAYRSENGPPTGWVTYRPPVRGPVVDPFRPPATPYAAGNRGIDYATQPGEPVVAAAAGSVTFAGTVAGAVDVVVVHADRLRTTYAGLADATVVDGGTVAAGDVIGHARIRLHFGVRAGRAYLDPAILLAPPERHARLVPVDD